MSLEGESEGDIANDDVVDNGQDADPGQDTQTEAPPTLEGLAGEMGWRPQEEWKGDPTKWKPAHEFMRSTVDVNHKLHNRLKGMEEQIGNMARTSAQVTERALAKQREELQAVKDEAFETGDRETFMRADKALNELPEAPKAPPQIPDETQDFITRHDAWFNKDREATQFALNRCEELAKMGLSTSRQLSTVEKEMKEYFPDLFPAPKPQAKAAPLNTPGNRGAQVSKKGFSALPPDAQKQALDYEARKVCSKEEFASIYFEDQQ